MKKLILAVMVIFIFTLATPIWAEDVATTDTTYEPYEFKSSKKEGFVIQDNGTGFCRINFTLTRVETSFIPVNTYYHSPQAHYDLDAKKWLEGWKEGNLDIYVQNPSQIMDWLISALEKWETDNPEKEIIEIDYINTGIYSAAHNSSHNGGLAPTTGCIIRYK